jgi:hypothetical protein
MTTAPPISASGQLIQMSPTGGVSTACNTLVLYPLQHDTRSHGDWKVLAELPLQRQPRCAGHQVPNSLTAPTRQGLNGAGLNQWLQGLRNRGLPHLPQLHQLSLGLNRSRIHLRPGQQPIPGGFAQLLLAASRIHAPHMTAVRIQPVAVG